MKNEMDGGASGAMSDDVAGGAAENGSVTHGEGDFKPVMVENEQEGGAEEKTLKTAPEGGDGRFEGSTEGDVEAGSSNKRKWVAIGAVLVLVAAAIGVGIWFVVGRGEEKTPEESGTSQVGEPGEKPEEPTDGLVDLSLDDEIVKELRDNFRRYRGILGFGWLDFYNEVQAGELSDATMLRQVIFNSVGTVECVGEASEEGWAEVCYDGQEVLEAAKRVFGRKIALYDGLSTGKCAETYDAENGIFVGNYRCGGSGPYVLRHDFVAAEKEGDKIYLYEAVVIRNQYDEDGEEIGYYKLGPVEDGFVKLGERLEIDPEIWLATGTDAESGYYVPEDARSLGEYAEQMDLFKWTFERDAEGNYVFAGLEKVR